MADAESHNPQLGVACLTGEGRVGEVCAVTLTQHIYLKCMYRQHVITYMTKCLALHGLLVYEPGASTRLDDVLVRCTCQFISC